MQLWHFHSDILKGFYASEVYAVGTNKFNATTEALKAFDNWAQAVVDDCGFWPLIDDLFNEDGLADDQLREVRLRFEEEATSKFEIVGMAFIHTLS